MTNLALVTNEVREENQNQAPTFADFWLIYPRRVARKDAEKEWLRLSAVERVDAITGLIPWRALWVSRGELEFVPHAATWLHGARWEDELPQPSTPQMLSASHAPAKIPAQAERTAMPDNVRELLAKLRK